MSLLAHIARVFVGYWWLLVPALAIVLVYLRTRPDKSIASMPSIPTFSFMWSLVFERKSQGVRFAELAKRKPNFLAGEPFRVYFLGSWLIDVRHPDHAKEVFMNPDVYEKFLFNEKMPGSYFARFLGSNIVNANGDSWKRQRRVINPAFHKSWETDVFVKVADAFLAELAHSDLKSVDVGDWMQRMTLDALTNMAFGCDFGSLRDPHSRTVTIYNRLFGAINDPVRLLLPFLAFLPTATNRSFDESLKEFDALMMKVIQKSRDSMGDAPRNLLDMMVMSVDHTAGLSDEELLFNCKMFMLAGHDTTANSLSCLLYFLARYPDVQARVFEEVSRVCPDGEAPSFEQQRDLPYLTQCIKETLRIYPSISSLPMRITSADTTLAGYRVRKDTMIAVNLWGVHRNPSFWPDAETFDPDRFSEEKCARMHPYQWVPFGAGMRSCIGINFSMIEQRCAVVRILQKYSLHFANQRPFEPLFAIGILLHPTNINLEFRPRA